MAKKKAARSAFTSSNSRALTGSADALVRQFGGTARGLASIRALAEGRGSFSRGSRVSARRVSRMGAARSISGGGSGGVATRGQRARATAFLRALGVNVRGGVNSDG